METQLQRLLTRKPSLIDLYNNRPAGSSIVLLYQYNYFSSESIREVRRFYIQVGSVRISTKALYAYLSVLMKFSNWKLKLSDIIHVKEHINGYALKIKEDVFLEAGLVYSLSVKRTKPRGLLFNTYKVNKAVAKKILKGCWIGEKIEEVSEELENNDDI